jgi:hypothetical protein
MEFAAARRLSPLAPRGVAQFGSALALGARGRGFESRHPDTATPTMRHPDHARHPDHICPNK